MIDWLLENKEWVFSGIGITALVVIWVLIKTVVAKKNSRMDSPEKTTAIQDHHNTETQTDNFQKQPVRSDLTPGAIIKAVTSVPPLQRKDIAKHYQGIRVRWSGSVSHIEEFGIGNHDVLIILNSNMVDSTDVVFAVNSSDQKGLALLDIGHKITVEGDIDRVTHSVSLVNVTLDI